ncbi:T9SS type A sorting domain-containing protein [Fibrella sp. HMF5335]|uniref:T9SS type A sorting domain-containing protein n=1 Tax=Fibrella rubiginis TaxID=2817060 RepID=A0A939GJY8_9BACT|nr:T9SS type A sorting domain-containing protein [Fibrella rubiginis]MBO0938175.1 T9SS type A sorting domain-containing protein [Fibrella rubiginis]
MFQTYAIVNVDGGTDSYRAGNRNADGATTFNNSSYGIANTSITLKGGEIKTFKNNGGDVTGARLYYRVYPAGSPAGAFTLINLPFAANLNGSGDQKWATTMANINMATGLPAGNYTLEVYWQITTNLGDRFDSNGGANVKASFTVSSTTLPVTLTSFNAKANNHMASLDWATATEQGNAYFDVERSADARLFEHVGRVEGRGTTSTPQVYSFSDESPSLGTNYYRLRQVDADGRFSYSPVRAVQIRSNGELAIWGNPAAEQLGVAGLEVGSTVDLLDLNGQLRSSQLTNNNRLHIDVRNLPSGTYLLRVAEPAGVQSKRVVVLH